MHQNDLSGVATKAGESYQALLTKLSTLRLTDTEGYVDFEDFLKAVSKLRSEKDIKPKAVADKTKIRLHGASENTTHTINEDEKESFVQHINAQLGNDKDIKHRLPIDSETMQVFAECKGRFILVFLKSTNLFKTVLFLPS